MIPTFIENFLHFHLENKKYYLVRNAGSAYPRITLLINSFIYKMVEEDPTV